MGHGLTDEQRHLSVTGAHQLNDMIPWCILDILAIDCQYLITRLQFPNAGTTLRYKPHNHRSFATRHKAKSQTSVAKQQNQARLRWMLIPSYAFGCLICGRLIQMTEFQNNGLLGLE